MRELQLRDLGGFVLDLYRFGEQRDRLVREKLDRVIDTDKEAHALEALLGEGRAGAVRTYEIRMPGVGGTCPSCGEFHATDARFCARCGIDLAAAEPEPATLATGEAAAPLEDAPAVAAVEDEAGQADATGEVPVGAPVPQPQDPGAGPDGDWPGVDEERRLKVVEEGETVQLGAVPEPRRRAEP
ncbi:MAG: zinc ribbon domain-containing protein [Actinomycetota bacterium]|nr:zinc ribbon domain-containing protein [Actinomycetota bacterium]